MPVVHISIVEGRDSAKVKACVKAVAHTVSEMLGAPLETVRVYATQVPAEHWAVGGKTKDEMSAPAEGGAQ
ncbi:tautomerase family protein [Mangrovibacter yixingensis]|uniref:tautomerase family protein n=1 Tax=Mangrovibacter yixingensis TaxID=1529639 RepID=UPI001CFBA106|nr:tautomerase family protein [Mangrovibacter yixingensis]